MNENLVHLVREKGTLLKSEKDLDKLLERIGDSRIVMLGGATHGTKEYYLWRSAITQRLIKEKGFSFVALESDWPECFEVNSYIKGYGKKEESSGTILRSFRRWPSWMWANEEVRELIEWMHLYNAGIMEKEETVGFYGLDVYSLWQSMEALMRYLRKDETKLGREKLRTACKAYQCFDPYGKNTYEYGTPNSFVEKSCEKEVIKLLSKLRTNATKEKDLNEMFLSKEINALVVKNAEKYYRSMLKANNTAWNLRDNHMAEVLDKLLKYHGPQSKVIVWAHNSHVGDASATSMKNDGLTNLGEIARNRYGKENVVLVGFGSYEGSVIAGDYWGSPMKKMPLPKAILGSWEWVFHRAGGADRLLISQDFENIEAMQKIRPHRSIGVVYDPYGEKGNYVSTDLLKRYDAFVYLDETQALLPLPVGSMETEEVSEVSLAGI